MAFTPDSRHMVAIATPNTVSLVDVGRRRIVWTRTVREGYSGDVALSPDGATIAFSYYIGESASAHLQLLDTATGSPRSPADLATTGEFGWAYSGRWLIASEFLAAPQAQLYDASTLEPIGTPFPTGPIPGGYAPRLVAVNGPGTLFAQPTIGDPLLWNVDPHSWLKIACTIAGRNLTRAEWQHYLPHRAYERTCSQYPAP
jgi:hypothetical protein